MDKEKIFEKIKYFCGYQERSIREVEAKLAELHCPKNEVPGIIEQLEAEGFLNNERFARTFASGKFRILKWGKRKISYELKMRGLPESVIRKGLEEIDEEEYYQTLKELLVRKAGEIKPGKNFKEREKILTFAVSKGFETSLVLEILKEMKF